MTARRVVGLIPAIMGIALVLSAAQSDQRRGHWAMYEREMQDPVLGPLDAYENAEFVSDTVFYFPGIVVNAFSRTPGSCGARTQTPPFVACGRSGNGLLMREPRQPMTHGQLVHMFDLQAGEYHAKLDLPSVPLPLVSRSRCRRLRAVALFVPSKVLHRQTETICCSYAIQWGDLDEQGMEAGIATTPYWDYLAQRLAPVRSS